MTHMWTDRHTDNGQTDKQMDKQVYNVHINKDNQRGRKSARQLQCQQMYTDRQTDRQTKREKDKWITRQTNRHIYTKEIYYTDRYGQTNRRMNRWTTKINTCTDRQPDQHVDRRTNKQIASTRYIWRTLSLVNWNVMRRHLVWQI